MGEKFNTRHVEFKVSLEKSRWICYIGSLVDRYEAQERDLGWRYSRINYTESCILSEILL